MVWVAALDDATEEREWGSVHMKAGTVVHALTAVLSSMHDIVTPVGQVLYDHASDPHFPFPRL